MARTYSRDRRGRFAPKGAGATARGGRLTNMKGKRYETQTREISGGGKGTISGKRKPAAKPAPAAPAAANNIRRAGRPMAQKRNNIKPYRPATLDGGADKMMRGIRKTSGEFGDMKSKVRKVLDENTKMRRDMARQQAREMAVRTNPKAGRADKTISRIHLSVGPNREAAEVIKARGKRAADAAARGSKPAKKALKIYDQQLASMTPANGKIKASNNIQPGRNNPKPPKPKRRGKKK